jgi:CRP/FNR family transcriptional regulator
MKNPPKQLHQFLDKYPRRVLKKGWPILYQGEIPRCTYVIKKGVVRIYDISSSGEEKIIAFSADNEFLPAAWAFEKAPVALYYYEAFTDTEVYLVPRDELRQALESNTEMMQYALDMYVTLYVGTTMHIFALEQTKASDKLLRVLQYLAVRFGEQAATNLDRIDLRLTHQDLARMIGMTRETTAVELGKLKKRGVISYQNQRYLINTKKVVQIIGEDEFTSVDM